MIPLTLQNIGFGYSTDLFQGVSLTVADGQQLGIVGNNGGGKSSLLRCIAGLLEPTTGAVVRSKKARFSFAEQEVPAELETVTMYEAIAGALPCDERDSLEWRVDVVLDSLDVPEELRSRNLAQLSGGWRRLTLIARAWAVDPDILLLDEPTNHLDLQKILKLEEWLSHAVPHTQLLVVSHDRRFLDNCTNRTLFLRPRESVTLAYPYSRARELLAESDGALHSRKEREQKEAVRLRQSSHRLRQIGVNNYSASALRKSIQIAKRAEGIEEAMTEVHVEPRRDIKLASSETHAKCLVAIQDIVIEKPGGGTLFRIGRLEICQGDRIVLMGRNGTGKTCFIERLRVSFADRDQARANGIRIAPSVVMGYVDQNMTQLPGDKSIGSFVGSLVGRDRAIPSLISAGFPVHHHGQQIGSLSSGQKARVALLALQLSLPNFYLMDEPTNHIDIPGQEQLEAEILAHAATGVLVSHDRTFVANTGTRFLVVDGGALFEIRTPEIFYESLIENKPLGEVASGLCAL